VPCGCSQKTGTVRRSLRDMFSEIEKEHPFLKETLLSAMGNVQTSRLLDTRFLDLDANFDETESPSAELVTLHSL
jgi:tRNA 2-thiocytidine biosynthesis protein TtcA